MRYLVVDISTTAQPGIEDSTYLSWANKKGSTTPEEAYLKAGLHPEYGMICGLSTYWVDFGEEDFRYKEAMTATASDLNSEEKLLLDFEELLAEDVVLVGQNLKDFIVPFLAKRFLGNGLRVPKQILRTIQGTKTSYDIMKILACGGQSVMSLRASTWMFGINDPRSGLPTPKFYNLCKDGNFDEIARLGKMNSIAAARVFGNCVLGGLIEI